ncbi:MAG: hypothetical protein ACJ761_12085 [Chloroflexota bacterium]
MTSSEFAFLALGLLLGVLSGAALVEFLRARPPVPREVRVTVTPDAIPRRQSATLSDPGFATHRAEPARGGPADRRLFDRRGTIDIGTAGSSEGSAMRPRTRTPVRSGGAAMWPSYGVAGSGLPRSMSTFASVGTMGGRRLVGIGIDPEPDPFFQAIRNRTIAAAAAATSAVERLLPAGSRTSPIADAPTATADASSPPELTPPGGAAASEPDPSDPCGETRRLADERCTLAARAKEGAATALDTLRQAQRAYDEHTARSEAAAREIDTREIRARKEAAQEAFRSARGGARTTEEVDAAARDWLLEINRINGEVREASAVHERSRRGATEIGTSLQRLTVEADAARISAEAAEAACVAARQAVADCDEAVAIPGGVPIAGVPSAAEHEADDAPLAAALGLGGEPAIFALLQGDRDAMVRLVAQLGGDDDEARRTWQLAMSDLVDAILAVAIEGAYVEFPEGHSFWSAFSQQQNRDVVLALASLGYRFDGLGGFVDGRVPSQRDLSLALGYAGIDPMRTRHWPSDAEAGDLFRELRVAGDEFLAGAAPGMTLGELVTALGRRADDLTEVWNGWGRVRPLLLVEAGR